MELGLVYTPLMAIPPQETAFVLTGYCTDKCTQMVSGQGPTHNPVLVMTKESSKRTLDPCHSVSLCVCM